MSSCFLFSINKQISRNKKSIWIFDQEPIYQCKVNISALQLIWNSISALQTSTVLYLFLKISNLAKYHFEFLLHLLSVPSQVGLLPPPILMINTFHLLHHLFETKVNIFPWKFEFHSPSGETLCLRWWGHKRAFKAVTLAPGRPLLAPWLWPLPEKTRDSHGFL